jgi:hypothetical protein
MNRGWRIRSVQIGLLTMLIVGLVGSGPAEARVSVFPSPGTPVVSETTTFSFRGVKPGRLGPVKIIGSVSGRHGIARRIRHSDGHGVSLVPKRRFAYGEIVRVRTHRKIRLARHGDFRIRIGRFTGGSKKTSHRLRPPKKGLKSRPDLKLPRIKVARTSEMEAPGEYFLGFRNSGLTILDNLGRVTWFKPTVFGFNNFEPQTLNGRPVLTYFRSPTPNRDGAYVILNRHYRKIAEVTPGNGYKADMHEFHLTGRGTALMLAYRTTRWNLKAVGGPADGPVADCVVQEIDLKTGAVLFEWHALGNIDLRGSRKRRRGPGSWDAFHLNSIEPDGNSFLVSSRWTSSIYRIGRASGRVKWTLRGDGGRSDFKVGAPARFTGQHDVRRLPNGEISLFDNAGVPGRHAASVLILKLKGKGRGRRAVRVARYRNPDGEASAATGGAEVLPDGNVLAGWGNTDSLTEFSPQGKVLFHARQGSSSYRARKAEWDGIPNGRPAIASKRGKNGAVTVYASWNGAGNIARWEVLAGPDADHLTLAGSADWRNLETAITLPATDGEIQVVAYDASDRELGRSALVPVGKRSR